MISYIQEAVQRLREWKKQQRAEEASARAREAEAAAAKKLQVMRVLPPNSPELRVENRPWLKRRLHLLRLNLLLNLHLRKLKLSLKRKRKRLLVKHRRRGKSNAT